MRIIRPYGSSKTENNERLLLEKGEGKLPTNIPAFAKTTPELIIAQWVSVIDKIAKKPKEKKSTQACYNFRENLGKASWDLCKKHLGNLTADQENEFKNLFFFKIHPYRNDKKNKEEDFRGRWYKTFLGDKKPADVNHEELAANIETHLFTKAKRINAGSTSHQTGLIEQRAQSIAKNVLKPSPKEFDITQLITSYAGDPDIITKIYNDISAKNREATEKPLVTAASHLHLHWAQIFKDENGAPLLKDQAKAQHPDLFAIHIQVKETYTRLLKRTKKRGEALFNTLPTSIGDLCKLNVKQTTNRDLSSLIRLGKIIHYTAGKENHSDETAAVYNCWPTIQKVEESHYWTSEGQAQIKRNEAFVRTWRHMIVMMRLSLQSWTGSDKDILGNTNKDLTGIKNTPAFDKHFALRYGTSFCTLTDNQERLDLINFIIKSASSLRHKCFHFTGITPFRLAIENLGTSADCPTFIRTLWTKDNENKDNALLDFLTAIKTPYFCNEHQALAIGTELAQNKETGLPLPRFNRVLLRHKNTNGHTLPPPAKMGRLENEALLFQYSLLKHLYTKSFRTWLTEQSDRTLKEWMDKAFNRSTEEAKKINGCHHEDLTRLCIKSRAEKEINPSATKNIYTFLDEIASALARADKPQNGYNNDKKKARSQSTIIDVLVCDVMGLAFTEYLEKKNLKWICNIKETEIPPQTPHFLLNEIKGKIKIPTSKEEDKPWQATLYALCHLVPVEEISKLKHQMEKWKITSCKGKMIKKETEAFLTKLNETFTLYLDRHDTKFDGSTPLDTEKNFRNLFEDEGDIDRLFPAQTPATPDRRLPLRGLREIMRFGHETLLHAIFETSKITHAAVSQIIDMEKLDEQGKSIIERAQRERNELHDLLTRQKNKDIDKYAAYAMALQHVVTHRLASAQTRLTNHVRLHKLLMSVAGRLVDFSGFYERDKYFTMLALLYKSNQTIPTSAQGFIKNGQIKEVIKKLDNFTQNEITKLFPPIWDDLRNRFAHLDMLQKGPINLTKDINDARKLMAYDRKLKNAVSKSIIDLLAREGLIIKWEVIKDHSLSNAEISTYSASHLGGIEFNWDKSNAALETKKNNIAEPLHDNDYCTMVASLFDGKAKASESCLVDSLWKIKSFLKN